MFVDDIFGLRGYDVPEERDYVLDFFGFSGFERGAGFAFYAADSFTGIQVALEGFGLDVGSYDGVLDYEHRLQIMNYEL